MHETTTIDAALSRGQRGVNYPSLAIMLGTIGLCFYLGIQKILPFWIAPAGFGFAFLFSWLYWSIMITKWRVWAFENVRNVHELKRRAIQERLIWPDDSIFKKTEIWTSADREKWNSLQYKFDKEDLFVDDITVAGETIIYYSKGKNFVEMAVMLICFGVGVYMLVTADYVWGGVLTAVGAYFSYREYKQATNTSPQIIINDKGVQTVDTEFYKWSEIENEEVLREGTGKHTSFYLVYDHPEGSEHLEIADFDTSANELNQLLILYRGRSKAKYTKGRSE